MTKVKTIIKFSLTNLILCRFLGFGISSDTWDHVFGTEIVLNKLKYVLNWK